jgi:hypothetical protein
MMATPLLEPQFDTPSASNVPTGFVSGEVGTELQVVTDCPADAWNESHQQAIADLRATFGDDQVNAHESALHRAAHELIEGRLRRGWRARGYRVTFTNHPRFNPDLNIYATPADEIYHEVWQAAADQISDRDLVLAADLGHEFPLATEMEMLRAALHYRLSEWANDDMSDTAQQQLDGWREAVDNAVTRTQLIAISGNFA